MAPMHHSGKDDPIDIGQNFLKWLALLGWLRWQRGTNCTRFAVRRNAQRFYFSTIIRDPIRQSMKLLPENFRRGLTEIVVSIFHSEITLPRFSEVGAAASNGSSYNDSVGMTNHFQNAKPKLKWNAPKSSCSRGLGLTP